MIKKLLDKTFWKFILVGIVNTLFGMAVMFSLDYLLTAVFGVDRDVSHWVSIAANYIFGSVLSYFLNKNFTFGNKDKSFKVVAKFVVNIVVCAVIAYGAATLAIKYILSDAGESVQYNVAKLAGMVLFVMLNYVGQRFFAFKEEK
ncbi:MAG: GtrA family protein [Lachnospiraceae bacterium]|nr:GtrA family protein [Lachnospiraceae bacterium]